MRKGAKINLLQDPTSPHGNLPSPSQYYIGAWRINDTLRDGEKVRLRITFAYVDEGKTDVAAYNSSAARGALLDQKPISHPFELDFEWKVYGDNNILRIYLSPNNTNHNISEVEFIELYRI